MLSELKIDPIVDGAFSGNSAAVETEFAKGRDVRAFTPGVIVSAGPAPRRRGCTNPRLAVAEGTPRRRQLLDSGFSAGCTFSRRGNVETALRSFQCSASGRDPSINSRPAALENAQAAGTGGRDRPARAYCRSRRAPSDGDDVADKATNDAVNPGGGLLGHWNWN